MDMNGWRVVSADNCRILGSRQAAHIIKAKWEDKGIEDGSPAEQSSPNDRTERIRLLEHAL